MKINNLFSLSSKILLLFILLFFLSAVVYRSSFVSDSLSQVALENLITVVIEEEGELEIRDLDSGDWTQVCILLPYGLRSLEKEVGRKLDSLKWSYEEFLWGVVFIYKNHISTLRFNRSEIDFLAKDSKCWTRKDSDAKRLRFIKSLHRTTSRRRIISLREDQ